MQARLSQLATWPFPLRLLAFVLILLAFWLPVVLVLWPFLGQGEAVRHLATTILYVELIGVLYGWGRGVRGDRHPWAYYGLTITSAW